jgi:hypothetical protein
LIKIKVLNWWGWIILIFIPLNNTNLERKSVGNGLKINLCQT